MHFSTNGKSPSIHFLSLRRSVSKASSAKERNLCITMLGIFCQVSLIGRHAFPSLAVIHISFTSNYTGGFLRHPWVRKAIRDQEITIWPIPVNLPRVAFKFSNLNSNHTKKPFTILKIFPCLWYMYPQSHALHFNFFTTVDNIRSFCGQCRSRSDCTKCAD